MTANPYSSPATDERTTSATTQPWYRSPWPWYVLFGLPPGLFFAGVEISAIGYVPYRATVSWMLAILYLVGGMNIGAAIGGIFAKLAIRSRLGVNYFRILGMGAAFVAFTLFANWLLFFTPFGRGWGWPIFLIVGGLTAMVMIFGAWSGARLFRALYGEHD
jgi:hypothetical protein